MTRAIAESKLIFKRIGYREELLDVENYHRDVLDVIYEKHLRNAKTV